MADKHPIERCPNCPQVPVVSKRLAMTVLQQVAEVLRSTALMAAFAWLTEKHEGLKVYEGINRRPYTEEEARAVALETQAAASLSCPFFRGEDHCLIGGLGTEYNRVDETGRSPYGWLPSWVALAWARKDYRVLFEAKQIADVKVCELKRNEAFLSQDETTGQIYVG